MHAQHVLYQHVFAVCQQAICIATCHYACMCNIQHESPKIKVHGLAHKGISLHTHFWRRLCRCWEAKPAWKQIVRDRWESHSQPAKGPEVHCNRYQGCTHRFGSFQGQCAEADWEKLWRKLFPLKIFLGPHAYCACITACCTCILHVGILCMHNSMLHMHIACWHIVYARWHTASTHLHVVCAYGMLCLCDDIYVMACCTCMLVYCAWML